MGISTSTWQTIVSDSLDVARDIDLALTAGAALGIPEAGVLEPLAALLAGVLAKVQAAQAGNLSALQAVVQSSEAAAETALAEKFPNG